MIITIARECGSGGSVIAHELSKKYNLPLYDLRRLVEIGSANGVFDEHQEFFAEHPVNSLMSALSIEADKSKIYQMVRTTLASLLPEDNFILLGRCGNVVYRDHKDCFRIFLCGNFEDRVQHIQTKYGLNRRSAEAKAAQVDEARACYHNYYTGEIWKQADSYDLCLNTSGLGIEHTGKIIESYINYALTK